MTPTTNLPTTEHAVLTVLAGVPLDEAAARVPMHAPDLADAVETYRGGGRAALEHVRGQDWYQVRIQFAAWDHAELVAATEVGHRLHQVHQAGQLAQWWFIRKHPCWRLRCRPGYAAPPATMRTAVAAVLDDLVATGAITGWWETIYEPETLAFGGTPGMNIAHNLFHADSHHILDALRPQHPAAPLDNTVGRRELSVLLCTTLLREARQDRHEQADVWHRVEQLRPLPTDTPATGLAGMIPDLQLLTALDTTPTSALFDPTGPLAFAAAWVAAFTKAGRHLADAARDGHLNRGLRDVLAHHVIFHWNRLGLSTRTQAILARGLRETVMTSPRRASSQ